jgi:hypothetical protein
VTDEQARVRARDGNVAVTWLADRAYPGIHVQGHTFAELHPQFADARAAYAIPAMTVMCSTISMTRSGR